MALFALTLPTWFRQGMDNLTRAIDMHAESNYALVDSVDTLVDSVNKLAADTASTPVLRLTIGPVIQKGDSYHGSDSH